MTSVRAVAPEDLFELCIPAEVRLSPDGSWLVWIERRVDRDSGKTVSRLMRARADGEPQAFTAGVDNDSAPRISPDGSQVAFVRSARNGGPAAPQKLCVIPTDGGEARAVLEQRGSFGAVSWSPDGRSLAVAFRRADELPEGQDAPLSIRVTRMPYKIDGEGYLPVDRYRIYRVDLTAAEPALVPVTDPAGDWDDVAPAWSPDGSRIAFLSGRRDDRALDPENVDLYVVAPGGGAPTQCTQLRGPLSFAAWSPDGAHLAAIGCPGPIGAPLFRDNMNLLLIDPSGQREERNLTSELDRCAMSLTIDDLWGLEYWMAPPAFSRDGRTIYAAISDHGTTWLAAVPVDGARPVERVVDDRVVVCFDAATRADRVALITTSETKPGWVEVCDGRGAERRTLARPLRGYCEAVDVRQPIELRASSTEGAQIQAWLLLPEGDGPFPLLLDIHGGPVVQFGRSFVHELQVFCARGYAVLFANPRGSQGYGKDFAAAIHRDWGTRPMDDLMACLDEVLAHHPIDADRLGVLGGSYGGYMTNWIIAHSKRFRAACTQRTVSSMEAMIWSDYGFTIEHEIGATYWEDPDIYRRMSPITYAADIETPLLILQGLDDHRTPMDQGERLFATLRVMGKESEMVLFPGAGHNLSRSGPPRQRIERLEVILEWFDRYLGGA
jgi:dipeptidyl aminopeptidase/acylaminoacyl peptidase